MANQAKRSADSMTVTERHGKAGEIPLLVGVPPWLKDALIDRAEAGRVPLKVVVVAALEAYVGAAA